MRHKATTCLVSFWNSVKSLNEYGSLGSSSTMKCHKYCIVCIVKDFVYEASSDYVIPTKIVDQVVLADDNKPVNVDMLSDVSHSLFEQQIVDRRIEEATV